MTLNSSKEQIVNEILESVLSSPESDFYSSSDAQIPKKESSRKRLDVESGFKKTNLAKKKRKETTKDRLLEWNEFYSNREFGIWIQCTKCNKWRKSLEYEEEHQVPKDWRCSMNMTGLKNCDDPENTEEVEFSETNFIPGSIVWAKLEGFPWWPGMVEDDPDTEEYYWFDENKKMYYNITFLDDNVTHAWVCSSFVQSYLKPLPRNHKLKRNYKNAHLVEDAKEKANAAIKMSIKERLQSFSFAHRFTGKWSRAIDFDDHEESENVTKMLIKEVEDIDYLKSSDSEDETNSLAWIQKTIPYENKMTISKKKKMDVQPSKNKNFDKGLENIILNEEYFASNKNLKEAFIVDNKMKMPEAETVIRDTLPDHSNLKIDKKEQQILHSLKTEKKKISAKLKSDTDNKPQKVSKHKIEENNKEMNEKKKSSRLGKSEKKGNLEKTDSVIHQQQIKDRLKNFAFIPKKTSFIPPVRNETEYHKKELNTKAISKQMSMNNRKSVIAHKNLNLNSNENDYLEKIIPEQVNEKISGNETKSKKSTVLDTDSDEEMKKQATSEENKNKGMPNKMMTELQIKTEISQETEERELICISDEEPLGTDFLKPKVHPEKEVLENVTQDKTNEISNKTTTAEDNIAENGKNHAVKPNKQENEILKVLEKNIKTINSETEHLNTKKAINEKNKSYSKKAINKTSDMKDKRDQKEENKSLNKKFKKKFKESNLDQKTCKKNRAVLKISKSDLYCPIKQNKQKNKHILEVKNTKTFHKPANMEIGDILKEQNDGTTKKYKDVADKSNSLSDSKIIEKSEESTEMSSFNCKSEINSYSLCLDNLNEGLSEDSDSDPFEAD